eukprot:gene10824-13264_t
MFIKTIVSLILLNIAFSLAQVPTNSVSAIVNGLLNLRSSSDLDEVSGVENSFLNKINRGGSRPITNGAWCAGNSNGVNEFIIAGNTKPLKYLGISIQGQNNMNNWVKYFKLSYTVDGSTWLPYNGNPEFLFEGNTDRTTVKSHTFSTPFIARSVKLTPTEYNGNKCLRWDLWVQSA